MNGYVERFWIAVSLFAGFGLLYLWAAEHRLISSLLKTAVEKLDAGTRERLLRERKRLSEGVGKESFWQKAERMLYYSGLKWNHPHISVEMWLTMQVIAGAAACGAGGMLMKRDGVLLFPAVFFLAEFLVIRLKIYRMSGRVNDDMPKFLDFMGNYNATGQELGGIFAQIAKYMDRPLSDALETCYREAQLSGDMKTALLSMREKIAHPQFKAFVSELEINLRYCADYSVLIRGCRKSLRDQRKAAGERKEMLREAVINAALLLGMSAASLAAVDALIDESVWKILIYSIPGRLSLSVLALILFFFAKKVSQSAD